MIVQGDKCVSECGCEYDNKTLKNGESIVKGCQYYQCSDGKMDCTDMTITPICSYGEELEYGKDMCHPKCVPSTGVVRAPWIPQTRPGFNGEYLLFLRVPRPLKCFSESLLDDLGTGISK
ncbi:hypothetical protein CHS0354_017309 [Potamilus streckersoni]|uniref:Uncharacterized protein n=1 Tax=Potamilus streckersoni TaxID=2493646 RepID=A0AAE0T4C7_9BIVA|nr:hypothetical protein CHS0354_017309 [Potamilus streckersoni]